MKKHSMNLFIKSQISSFISTLVDFGVTILLKEVGGLWYLSSTSAGSILGGITNFLIGRRWVFKVTGISPVYQAIRYLFVWGGSIFLNISGVFLLTSRGHLNYLVSKVIVSVIVGVFFNYILQKQFVFSYSHENRETPSS